jgi:neutral ceramidase
MYQYARMWRTRSIVRRGVWQAIHIRSLMLAIGFSLLVLGGAMPSAHADLLAGAARVDITPDVKASKIPLGGYAARRGAPSTGVHDPVYAHALVLSSGQNRVAIVSLDLCFSPASIKTEVMKRLETQTKSWSAGSVFLAATHTHSAPDPLAMHAGNSFDLKGWTPFDAKLLSFTADKIAAAIEQADKAQRAATVGVGVVPEPSLNRNRRDEKLTDPDLTVLKVMGTDGKAIAAVVNYAAHPTLYDDKMLEVSADWPGVMAVEVEKALGDGSVCLFLNGAEGDASPNGVDDKQGDEKITAYGRRVAGVVTALLPSIQPESAPALSVWSVDVQLPARKPNGMFLAAAGQLGASFAQARALVDALMPKTTTITMVKLGRLLLIGTPCEPTAELGLQMKAMARKAGVANPAVVALTNDWLAYALMPEQYQKGNYEAMMSFYGDQLGPALLRGVEAGLKPR